MLRLYSTLVVLTLIIICMNNVEKKPSQELKWGAGIICLVPVLIFLLVDMR
ncbi:hypothetical protein SAMN04488528_1001127 [Clostridium frigidicarnis]|uniref:Uncharacterized protein n=1 Tax=Clostridium frigidicarnis TaxID=84698 RepID=A0A1I0V370_9CLOT|nr:hypothetical protein SAMN04488528_1001127 [Clostridium frigidicarnis]